MAGAPVIQLIEFKTSGNDTSFLTVTVHPLPTPKITAEKEICPVEKGGSNPSPGADRREGCIAACDSSVAFYSTLLNSGSSYTWSVVGAQFFVPNINEIVGVIESLFGVTAFPSDIYYLDKLPSEIQYMDSILIVIFSIIICFLASLYPAWRAAKLNPVDGLRYE